MMKFVVAGISVVAMVFFIVLMGLKGGIYEEGTTKIGFFEFETSSSDGDIKLSDCEYELNGATGDLNDDLCDKMKAALAFDILAWILCLVAAALAVVKGDNLKMGGGACLVAGLFGLISLAIIYDIVENPEDNADDRDLEDGAIMGTIGWILAIIGGVVGLVAKPAASA